jgi:hypothetical protein
VLTDRVGIPNPAPKPRSRYLKAFAKGLKAKLSAIAEEFDATEIERLKRLWPALSRRLDVADPQLVEPATTLLCMNPPDAVAWIRAHLDEFETRYAS